MRGPLVLSRFPLMIYHIFLSLSFSKLWRPPLASQEVWGAASCLGLYSHSGHLIWFLNCVAVSWNCSSQNKPGVCVWDQKANKLQQTHSALCGGQGISHLDPKCQIPQKSFSGSTSELRKSALPQVYLPGQLPGHLPMQGGAYPPPSCGGWPVATLQDLLGHVPLWEWDKGSDTAHHFEGFIDRHSGSAWRWSLLVASVFSSVKWG